MSSREAKLLSKRWPTSEGLEMIGGHTNPVSVTSNLSPETSEQAT